MVDTTTPKPCACESCDGAACTCGCQGAQRIGVRDAAAARFAAADPSAPARASRCQSGLTVPVTSQATTKTQKTRTRRRS